MRMSVFLVLALGIVMPALAEIGPDLRLEVSGHAPFGQTPNGGRITFMDERVTGSVDVAYADPAAIAVEQLDGWWKDLHIVVSDAQGIVRQVSGAELQIAESVLKGNRIAGSPAPGVAQHSPTRDGTYIRFELPPLPPGDYMLRATAEVPDEEGKMVSLASYFAPFSVRRGDENRDVRRLYLWKRRSVRDFEEFKKVTAELRTLEPDNYFLAEELALRSLYHAPANEIVALYRDALALRQAAARREEQARGRPLTKTERAELERDVLRLTLFERVADEYTRGDRRLVPFTRDTEPGFAWADRSGRILGVIDLRDPSIVRPIARPRMNERP